MESRTTPSLIADRAYCIKYLETLESLEKTLEPGEKINEKTRWSLISGLLNIERELIRRGEKVTPTRFTSIFFKDGSTSVD